MSKESWIALDNCMHNKLECSHKCCASQNFHVHHKPMQQPFQQNNSLFRGNNEQNNPQQNPFGSQGNSLFGRNQPNPPLSATPSPNIFGLERSNSTTLFENQVQPSGTQQGLFGSSQQQNSPFGSNSQQFGQSGPSVFGNQQPFGSSTNHGSPFGGSAFQGTATNQFSGASTSGASSLSTSYQIPTSSFASNTSINVQQPTPYGQTTPQQAPQFQSNPQAQPTFGSNSTHQNASFFTGGSVSVSTDKPTEAQSTFSTPSDDTRSTSSFISSMKDNTVNLYNLRLKEIIDIQTNELAKNIKEFKKVAQAVFEQVMRLIKAKNKYLQVKEKIETEEARLAELEEGLDCLSSYLDEKAVGPSTEIGKCCDEFESICDRFYKRVESLRDDQDEVMDLVNTNYTLIDAIDKKMGMLDDFRL